MIGSVTVSYFRNGSRSRVNATPDRRMITSPSSEEGNIKTYNLVLQISRLMTQLGNAWQELARSVRDSSLSKLHMF
jgi:hypothetical protein